MTNDSRRQWRASIWKFCTHSRKWLASYTEEDEVVNKRCFLSMYCDENTSTTYQLDLGNSDNNNMRLFIIPSHY